MISLFGTTLGALSPWLLLAIPCVLGFLIYVFRKRGTSNKTIVSSLFLLQLLPRKEVGRRAFVPPLQFWLELCAAALLILASAGLFTKKTGKRVAVVIDASLSMGALFDVSHSRLEQGKRMAATDISRARSGALFSLFSSSGELTPRSAQHIPSREAISSLDAIKQSFSADNLQSHLTTLANDPSYDAVWVYTDHDSGVHPPNGKLLVNSLPIDRDGQANLWIRSLRVRPDTQGDSLLVTLGSSSAESKEASITARCVSPSSGEPVIPPKRTTTVSPLSGALVSFPLGTSGWSQCEVTVSLDGGDDKQALDDQAWIANQNERPDIQVVGSLSPETLGLNRIPAYTFREPPPSPNRASASNIPTIYHRGAPSTIPETPTLSVLPPEGSLSWGGTVETRARGGDVTKWEDSHPLLAYVNPALLALSDLRPLVCPPSARAILSSAAGSLLCAGEERGARYVITAFELLPFDGAKSPTLSILTLNILKWLFAPPSTAPSSGGLPSRVALAPSVTAARYIAPREEALTVGNDHAIHPPHPGILALTDSTGGEKLLALNAIDDRESNIADPSTLTLPPQSTSVGRPASTPTTTSLSSLLALLALSVLGLDLVRRALRRVRWSDA